MNEQPQETEQERMAAMREKLFDEYRTGLDQTGPQWPEEDEQE